jgi:hypothetical protein
MSAAEIITDLQADGVRLSADGDRLLAEPRSAITDAHRHLIRTHKPALLAHLQAANEPADDHQAALDELADERAAILEHDGGLSRAKAERIAKGAARAYYSHIMRQLQTRCGCRTTGWTAARVRLCAEGQRLKDAYHRAVEATETATQREFT